MWPLWLLRRALLSASLLATLVIEKSPEHRSGLFDAWYRGSDKISALGKMMAKDDKTKAAASKKEPVVERKTAEAAPKTETVKTETVKTETGKAEGTKTEGVKPDAAPSKKGMGEGQKPVTQAYKDNWNSIFAKKKKR
jgi:hypothetical protein